MERDGKSKSELAVWVVAVKFTLAVSLLSLIVVAGRPARAQGDCPDDAELGANCYTADEYGNQSCESNHTGPLEGTVGYCQLVNLEPSPDYPNVHTGCNGSTCTIEDPCDEDPYAWGCWW